MSTIRHEIGGTLYEMPTSLKIGFLVAVFVVPAWLSAKSKLLVGVPGFVTGVYLLYSGFRRWQTKRAVEDTPTESVRSVAVGRTELQGTVRSAGETLPAPFTDEECVYVNWQVQYYASNEWKLLADGYPQTVPFRLDDGTGSVLVAADEGEPSFDISVDNRTVITVGDDEQPPSEIEQFIEAYDSNDLARSVRDSPLGALKDRRQPDTIGEADHSRRYKQRVLPVGEEAYVLGSAIEREDAEMNGSQETLLKITRDEEIDEFVISDRGEGDLEGYLQKWGPVELGLGFVLATLSLSILVGVV